MIVEVTFPLPIHKSFSYISEQPLQVGMRVEAPFGNRKLVGLVTQISEKAPEGMLLRTVTRILDAEPVMTEALLELARWISWQYFSSYGEALFTICPSGLNSRSLSFHLETPEIPILTPAQNDVLQKVLEGDDSYYYLQGITGSGKTEVFLHLAQKILEQGKSVVYLVPEIGLSYQLIESIGSRFEDQSAIIHSRLTASQRIGQWRAIQKGEKRLVVGTRSAVFAPVRNLGLIIIDEEQDNSYKSGNTPRYHARQVAMKRVLQEGGKLLMGSATPSLEAWYFMEKGIIPRLFLSQRVAQGKIPHIALVDMKKESMLFSLPLIQEIRDCKEAGLQSILFINRRGFAHIYACRSCSFVLECRRCSVPLVYHRSIEKMLCHYCGLTMPPPTSCQDCGSVDVSYLGFGSQRVEEELATLFPDCRIARLDSDTARKKGYLERVFSDFRERKIDILLGTQMITKGLNFPGVRLVGIVLADTGLTIPDFRAQERVFSQIVQVAGRAGRYAPDGRVLIQTYRPQNPAIQYALHNQQEEFCRAELLTREELHFPPFYRIIRIVFRGKNTSQVTHAAHEMKSRIPQLADIEIRGPTPCMLSRVANNHRHHILFISKDFLRMHQIVDRLLKAWDAFPAVYLEVDVDPLFII